MRTYLRGVDRRALGAALLLTTLLVAIIVPQLREVRIAGRAEAAAVTTPPAIGACVLGDPRHSSAGAGEIPALRYGGCGGPHYGEVVQVFADSSTFPRVLLDQIGAPDASTCDPAISSYLATDQVMPRNDRGDYRSVSFGTWRPLGIGSVGLIGPSSLQRAAGQRWIACVTEGNGSPAVVGTVRDAFAGGRVPNSYAVCADDLAPGSAISCSGPHRVELFASTGLVYGLPTLAELNSSCNDFIRYLTGRKDLSAGGRLQVRVAPVYYGLIDAQNSGPFSSVQTQPAQAFCGVAATGSSTLTSTLFGVGDGPLPLS